VALANGVTDPEQPVFVEKLIGGFRFGDRARQP
jgi:hypothetical protein